MKQYILACAAGFACLGAAAQQFNPTVEVTNTYEGSLKGIDKPALVMAVPDSVTRFDLSFDYSVSDRPYRGAYDFQPYMVHMRPQTSPMERKRFFLRAGAGWTLHPELEAVFSPKTGRGLDLNFYARHRSYWGPYRHLTIQDAGQVLPDGSSWQGYRSSTRVGMDGAYGWKKAALNFEIAYRNLMTRGEATRQQLNGGEASLSIRSTDPAQRLVYELMLKGAADAISAPDKSGSDIRLDADGAVGARLWKGSQALLGFNAQYDINSLTQTAAGAFSLIPQYRHSAEGRTVRLGVRIATMLHPDGSVHYQNKGQIFYPDVYLSQELLRGKLLAFASATGGERVNSFSILGARNSFYPTNFGIVENTVERFNLAAGLRANLFSRMQLSLKAGFAVYGSQVWDALLVADSGALTAAYVYRGGTLAYAEADAAWISDHFRMDAHLKASKAGIAADKVDDGSSVAVATDKAALGLPLLTGGARFAYSWKTRIRAGAQLSFATERPGVYVLPGWVDLGLFAELALSRRIALWVKGENLLNQSVQRIPLIVEKGPAVTAGVQFSF